MQLDSAGIFVKRMEVAMSAVMAKNGHQTTYDQFAARNAEILAQLPEDQRNNIAAYFSGSTSMPGLTPGKLIEQYLAWAKLAVFKTRVALDRGAPNRASDFFKGSPIVAFGDRSKSEKPEEIAEFAKTVRGGNCEEFSATAFVELKQMGARPIRWFKLNNADHAFVMIGHQGRIFQMDDAMLKTLGASMVVCDAWNDDYFIASRIPERLPGYKAPFHATSYADFGC
ncbi:hypothetical protein Pan44_11000 [Caulifigura coniformis]|uniref:Uncharacterized protein n=1 Tax=Caulifigura coniformis TaxID=2527983 RepID=A0A517SAB8_9PLAN|nr:hypothetical protein [Caulifigura coniformis]QDT53085.1 hypothetical protein Pan44_11000 [Caulifigura coniformis]